MNMLALGWGPAKAGARHKRYARALLDRGVQWRDGGARDVEAATRLVREYVLGTKKWTKAPESGVLVAVDAEENVIGAAVVGGAEFDGRVVAFIQHLVVDPAWRGSGVGVVTLGTSPQLFSQVNRTASYFVGSCAADAARFYQRAGFNVLQPGAPLVIPGAKPVQSIVQNEHYPCWFYRDW